MGTPSNLKAALLAVRAYLAREAQAEEFRNEAAWEAGSSREEHAAVDALARLDEALRQLKPHGSARSAVRSRLPAEDSTPKRGSLHRADLAA